MGDKDSNSIHKSQLIRIYNNERSWLTIVVVFIFWNCIAAVYPIIYYWFSNRHTVTDVSDYQPIPWQELVQILIRISAKIDI